MLQSSGAAHSAQGQLLTLRRNFRKFLASSKTGAVSAFRTFGCASTTRCPPVEAPPGRFAHAASETVNQTEEEGTATMYTAKY